MLGWSVEIMIAVMISSCASSQQPNLPPPPPQPEVFDPDARAIVSGLLLDKEEEMDLVRQAEVGRADAAFRLSLHFLSAGDQAQQEHWQLVAAQRGHRVAQYNQWFDLRSSRDCAAMREALAWLEAAAAGGFPDAQEELDGYARRVSSCVP